MSRVKIDLPGRFQFSTDIPVRIGDINYGGHLGNDALLSILQEARVQLLRCHGWNELNVEGVGLIMTDAAIAYRSEAFCGDVLRIDIAVSDFSSAGCDIVYRVRNVSDDRLVAQAKTGIAFFDYAARRVVAVPSAFADKFRTDTGHASNP